MSAPAPKILLIGGSGMLGRALGAELRRRGIAFAAPAHGELDLEEADLEWRVGELAPRAVINTAAYSDVIRAEQERELAFRLNRDAPGALSRACASVGATLVHVSTDFVFDGARRVPYREDDPVGPLQVYGQSKLDGERRVLDGRAESLIARVSTLFGPGPRARPHYVEAILRQARERRRLEVVRPPVSSPTYTPHAARAILELLERGARGIVHVVNDGHCSRLELARATVRAAGLADDVAVVERPEPAGGPARPAWSVLDTSRLVELLGAPLPTWDDGVRAYVESRR